MDRRSREKINKERANLSNYRANGPIAIYGNFHPTASENKHASYVHTEHSPRQIHGRSQIKS